MVRSVIIIRDGRVGRKPKAVGVSSLDELRKDFDFGVVKNRSVDDDGNFEFIGGNDVDAGVLKSPRPVNALVGRALNDLKRI